MSTDMRHQGLESLEARLDGAGNRLALALVAHGVYVLALLLMRHSVGPRVFGHLPQFALIGSPVCGLAAIAVAVGGRRLRTAVVMRRSRPRASAPTNSFHSHLRSKI